MTILDHSRAQQSERVHILSHFPFLWAWMVSGSGVMSLYCFCLFFMAACLLWQGWVGVVELVMVRIIISSCRERVTRRQ